MAFSIKTSSAAIATPGDTMASRWVKRRTYNGYSGQEIVQEFQIFFVKSTFCRDKTATIDSAIDITTPLSSGYTVGSGGKVIPSQLELLSNVLRTSADDASHC